MRSDIKSSTSLILLAFKTFQMLKLFLMLDIQIRDAQPVYEFG